MLRELPKSIHPDLLVGLDTGDDAGIFRLRDDLAIVQTMDFFTPIVDDPYRFGAIAAANALSDVYAMGGRPITAMNIVCFPASTAPPGMLGQILRGGYDKTAESGAVIVGGHSVEDPEPKFGMSVTGLVDPKTMITNAAARPGEVIVLTKPIGTGVITTAAKYDDCEPDALEAACASMLTLNAGGARAATECGVHAGTDITGFGLIGHLYKLAVASGVGIEIAAANVPFLPHAEALAARGHITRGSVEGREYLGDDLDSHSVGPLVVDLLLDPQTSGGLALCIDEDRAANLVTILRHTGAPAAATIGRVVTGPPRIIVRP